MIRVWVTMLVLFWGGLAQAQCRHALALALDVSGSVDAREYRQQIDGVAQALDSPEVRQKFMAFPAAPVRLLIFEWSGPNDQQLLLPWTEITSETTLDDVIETLRQTRRRNATPGTALGVAMTVGRIYLGQQKSCEKRTLDISGDGKSNLGPRPREVHSRLIGSGITINGLVIGADSHNMGATPDSDIGALSSYYRAEVIFGPGAFVQTAIGFSDYAQAMQQKLLRELDGMVFSTAPSVQIPGPSIDVADLIGPIPFHPFQ